METMQIITAFLDMINDNPFAAVVLIALVAVGGRLPPKE